MILSRSWTMSAGMSMSTIDICQDRYRIVLIFCVKFQGLMLEADLITVLTYYRFASYIRRYVITYNL